MGLQHLMGRRTGRPAGSKSRPPWIRAAHWAFENLDNPDAVPPSALAGRLLALGRKHPDRLALCLARLDALGAQAGGQKATAPGPSPGAASGDVGTARRVRDTDGPRRLVRMFISEALLMRYLTGQAAPRINNLPSDANVVGCHVDPERNDVLLTFYCEEYPTVERGAPIPEWAPDFAGAPR